MDPKDFSPLEGLSIEAGGWNVQVEAELEALLKEVEAMGTAPGGTTESLSLHDRLRQVSRSILPESGCGYLWFHELNGEVWVTTEKDEASTYFTPDEDIKHALYQLQEVRAVSIHPSEDPVGEGWQLLGSCGPGSTKVSGTLVFFRP
jgi:hypothetical protein